MWRVSRLRLISSVRLDIKKVIQSVKSVGPISRSESKTCFLNPQEQNNPRRKTNIHVHIHTNAHINTRKHTHTHTHTQSINIKLIFTKL